MSSVLDDDDLPLAPPMTHPSPAPLAMQPLSPMLPPAPPPPRPILTQPKPDYSPRFDPTAAQSQQALDPEYRLFGDPPATRKLLFDNVLAAAGKIEPVTNNRFTLSLGGVGYSGPERYSTAEQKKAILQGRTLGRKLQGTWTLSDTATGAPIATRKSTLAQVPYLTDRGTFISQGSEYTMAHQMRLRPGAYTREKENGELETHVNVLPGQGVSHRIFLEPKSGVFRIQLGQARIPLLPVMRALGVKDQQLREVWGNDLTAVNMAHDDPKAFNKLYDRLVRNGDPDAPVENKAAALASAIGAMKLDPDTTERTLGRGHQNINGDTYLDISKKLLAVSRGEADPDDRDELAFQTLMGPEDQFPERLNKAKFVMRRMLWKSAAKSNLDHVGAGPFTDLLNSALMGSGLGMPLEEINPADLFDQQARVTRMGEGGIPSLDAVPDESRAVQPSQFGFIDTLRTPESGKVGVDLRLARSARKGRDGKFYTQVRDTSGNLSYKTAQEVSKSVVAFPGEMARGGQTVGAFVNGKPRMVHRAEVQFEYPQMEDTFSPLGNMIPLKSMVKGQRAVMASRMLTQALPILDPESPLVQSGMPGVDGRSFEDEYGKHMGAIHADGPGRVVEVRPDAIVTQGADGKKKEIELYDNFPFNRKTFVHHTPLVKPGDSYEHGQLLAHSNFTDKAGSTALGKNARVAYIPWGGMNFEDAIVISKSFADKMRSEHMYQHSHEWTETSKKGKKAYMSIFPAMHDRKTLDRFDDDGVIKPGTVVQPGDPLILAVREREMSRKQVLGGRKANFLDESQTWDHHEPGIVTDVHNDHKGMNVVVKSSNAMQVGDKLSGRYGDKGVISYIAQDNELPTDAQGRPFEVLLNPLGIISRVNPAQIVEAALGKVAAITGKPYKLTDFSSGQDYVKFAKQELRKHGLSDLEDVVDQATGRKIPKVLAGNRFFMKLHHTSESKAQGRGIGSYTAEGTPAKGGETGAKRIGMLELSSLLSHGATQVIRDAKLTRGQAAPQAWAQFMSGHKMPTPEVPYVYRKFVAGLRGAGIHPVRTGSQVHLMALTDKDVDQLSGDREIQNAETVDWKAGLAPKKGGLFDETLTGGHNGNRWSKITLHEPMPSPVMEEPIRKLLGLTQQKFEDIIAGKEQFSGTSGPKAIAHALDSINIDKELERARADIASNKRTARDAAVRRLGYLKDAQRLGLHPRDWVLGKVPVLPPSFRPVAVMGNKKLPLVSDPNYLYADLLHANNNLKELSTQVGDDDVGDERLHLYNAFKAVTGLGDPVHPKNQERQVKGILKHVFGSSPKFGTVQQRLLGSTVDMVGRAVITPNPNLDMDEVGVPEDRAWEIYRPFLVRSLVQQGMPRLQAVRSVEDRSAHARKALLETMDSRPVIINRAPTLHRYGMMAAWPKLMKGDTLQISPLVVGGFGADFDGDAMQYHVPVTDEASREAAEKMLPSRNLFSAASFGAQYKPSQEYVGGLYEASARVDKQNKPRVFATTADAIRAYMTGEIGVDRQVEILNH